MDDHTNTIAMANARRWKGETTANGFPHRCPFSLDGMSKERCIATSGSHVERNRLGCCGAQRDTMTFEPCNSVARRCWMCLEMGRRGANANAVVNTENGTCAEHAGFRSPDTFVEVRPPRFSFAELQRKQHAETANTSTDEADGGTAMIHTPEDAAEEAERTVAEIPRVNGHDHPPATASQFPSPRELAERIAALPASEFELFYRLSTAVKGDGTVDRVAEEKRISTSAIAQQMNKIYAALELPHFRGRKRLIREALRIDVARRRGACEAQSGPACAESPAPVPQEQAARESPAAREVKATSGTGSVLIQVPPGTKRITIEFQ